jgi:hypothetical protein
MVQLEFLRNVHAGFEPFLAGKAHGYCAISLNVSWSSIPTRKHPHIARPTFATSIYPRRVQPFGHRLLLLSTLAQGCTTLGDNRHSFPEDIRHGKEPHSSNKYSQRKYSSQCMTNRFPSLLWNNYIRNRLRLY